MKNLMNIFYMIVGVVWLVLDFKPAENIFLFVSWLTVVVSILGFPLVAKKGLSLSGVNVPLSHITDAVGLFIIVWQGMFLLAGFYALQWFICFIEIEAAKKAQNG